MTIIPDGILKELGLIPRGVRKVQPTDKNQSSREYPAYYISLIINGSMNFELQVISMPKEYTLVGRDVLNQIILYANGPKEIFDLNSSE